MQTFWQDLRYSARSLSRRPSFSLITVITLSLGIGATTAIYTLVNAVLLRSLPYPESEALMEVGRAFGGNAAVSDLSPQKFSFLSANLSTNLKSFQSLAAAHELGPSTHISDPRHSPDSEAEPVRTLIVSAGFFRTLGVFPALGREFTEDEATPAGERVAILGHRLWRERFNADAGMIGRAVALNGVSYTVIGIMPPGFVFYGPQDLLLPMRVNPANEGHNWRIIGRLRKGFTPEQARAELKILFDEFRAAHPHAVREGEIFSAERWRTNMTSGVSDLLWILLGAVACLLLVACANVANLQLARAHSRQKELSIRMALGASGSRLIRQVLTEGIVLAAVGGGAGLLIAVWGLDGMLSLMPAGLIPRTGEVSLDLGVLTFTASSSLLAGMVSSLVPALQTLRVDVNRGLKEGRSGAGEGLSRGRLRGALVVVEIALALLLTTGAGLLLRTFANLRGVEPGFEPAGVMSFEAGPRGEKYDTLGEVADLYGRALERLRALPGVEAIALTNKLPLDSRFNLPYRLSGQERYAGAVEYRLITPDYFRVMKMSLQRGRAFDESDRAGGEPVIIVNEAFARANFPGAEPLGQQMCAGCEHGDPQMRRIIGVVNETKQRSLAESAPATVFIPLAQAADGMREIVRGSSFVVRAPGDPQRSAAAVRDEMKQLDAAVPVRNMRALDELISRSVAPQRFNLWLLGSFAGLGLLLAAVGIYGVISYGVSQRTEEIGLRMALGAQRGDVVRMIVGQGMKLAFAGVVIGLSAAFALTRLMRSLLYGVSATDPATFTLIGLIILAVALIACYLPARRAAGVDPMIALRYE